MSNDGKLDLCTKIMILEAKRLPLEQFILFQTLYDVVEDLKEKESIDYKDRGVLNFSINLSNFYKFTGLSENKLYKILSNHKLNLWDTVTVNSPGQSFVSNLIPQVHIIPEDDYFGVCIFNFENITFKQAMFLSNKELEANKFLRRVYKRANNNNWIEYIFKNPYKPNE